MKNILNIIKNTPILDTLLNLLILLLLPIKNIGIILFSTAMQSESKNENTTTCTIEEKKPDLTAPLKTISIEEGRKLTKTDSLKMINNCLLAFTKMVDEGVTIEKCDAITTMILQTLMFIDINIGNIIAMDDDLIYSNKEMTELDPNKLLSVYELVLWKRINNHLDDQYKLGIIDNISFLRDIKNYIENVCYKNITCIENNN